MARKKTVKTNPLALLWMLRPTQWIKNGFVFAPLVFALEFNNHQSWVLSVIACMAFICASSIVYIFNDMKDLESDRHHPEKRFRALASGQVSIRQAFFTAAFLIGIMVGLVLVLPYQNWVILALYLVLNVLYTFWLKRVAIVDVLIIGTGFVLRVLMGSYAIGVELSPYLLVATLMLSLFLGFSKRYHELRRLGQPENTVLGAYNMSMLDRMISVSCGAALMTYVLYTVEVAKKYEDINIVYTTVFVVFGLFRYLQYIYYSKKGGAPERILYSDPLFIGNIVVWLLAILWVLARHSS